MAENRTVDTARKANECLMVPLTDIYESPDSYTLKMEMPGVTKENLEIIIEHNNLEVKGRVAPSDPEGKELKYSECATDGYYRRFTVGNDIDRNNISATFENGVLTLVLNKQEEVKPKKIQVNVG